MTDDGLSSGFVNSSVGTTCMHACMQQILTTNVRITTPTRCVLLSPHTSLKSKLELRRRGRKSKIEIEGEKKKVGGKGRTSLAQGNNARVWDLPADGRRVGERERERQRERQRERERERVRARARGLAAIY